MRASMGIMDTIGLAASLVFAIPVAIFGLNRLLDGQQLFGAGLLVVAALMVLLPQKLTTPMDIPQKLAGKAVDKAVKTPDDEEQ